MGLGKITIGSNSVDLRQVNELMVVKLHHTLSWSVTLLLVFIGLAIALFGDLLGANVIVRFVTASLLVIAAIACHFFTPLAAYNVRVMYINGRSVDLECLSNGDAEKVKLRIEALVKSEKEQANGK